MNRPVLGPRMATVGVAYAFAVTMVGTTLPTPLYPIYQAQIGFSSLIVTVVFAAYGLGVLAALLLVGQLSDRYGRRSVLLPGLALAALSSVVFLLAHDLALLFVGRVLSGLSAGIFTGTATAALLDLAPEHLRQKTTLLATAVNIGGLGLGPVLAGALAQLVGDPLRLPYAVHLALLVPAAVALWRMPASRSSGPAGGGRGFARLSVPAEMRPTFIRAGTVALAAFATMGLFTAVAPAFLDQLLGLHSHLLTGGVVLALFAASTAGQLALEPLGAARSLPLGCAVMIPGMGVIALGLAVSSLALLLIGAVLAGLGSGLGFRAGLVAVNGEAPADRRGEVNSSLFVVAYLALSLPIVGVGVAAEAFGLRAAGLAFSGGVTALVLAVLLSLSSSLRGRRPGKPRTEAMAGSTGSQ